MKLGRAKDLTGTRFGRLVVKSLACKSRNGTTKWHCVCYCGVEKVIFSTALNRGQVSCGCEANKAAAIAHTKHSLTGSITYRSWRAMKARCLNEKTIDYPRYGGRGIKVCDRWLESFENFFDDMGTRPEKMTLERRDTDGNYEPSNCRWATAQEQASNRSTSQYIEKNGERLTISEAARVIGTTRQRLRYFVIVKGIADYEELCRLSERMTRQKSLTVTKNGGLATVSGANERGF
jgi:hypothetical protein